MGPVRKAISLILASALATIGFGFLAYLLFAAQAWKGWMVLASGFTGTIGALWLYEDFIKPEPSRLKSQTKVAASNIGGWDINPATMAGILDSIRPVQTDQPLRQTLMEDFPRDCSDLPIAGGWGYSQKDAIAMVRDKFSPAQAAGNFVALEYHIAQKIIYEELIIFRPKDFRFSGIEIKLRTQELTSGEGGRQYDVLEFAVTCWSDWHWEQLKQEWEDNDFGENPNFARDAHAAKRSASQISYDRKLWFSDVYRV